MVWRLGLFAFACAVLGASGCARRDAPYRFRSPLVGAVAAAEIRAPKPRLASEPEPESTPAPPSAFASQDRTVNVAPAPAFVRRERPAYALEGKGRTLASWLRSLVGARDPNTSNAELAIRCLVAMGARLDADIRGTHAGKDLVALARSRGALVLRGEAEALPLLGDLVVFDNVEPGEAASLIGVVVSTDSRGTIELIYLARGVVRRGFLTPTRPGDTRDASGRSLNTFVRAGRPGDPLDAEYMSSALYAGYIRLDKLQD